MVTFIDPEGEGERGQVAIMERFQIKICFISLFIQRFDTFPVLDVLFSPLPRGTVCTTNHGSHGADQGAPDQCSHLIGWDLTNQSFKKLTFELTCV